MRPTLYLTGRGKPHRWSKRDRGLAEGLLTYEESLNPIGIPAHIARDKGRKFVIDEIYDGSLAVLDEAQEEARKGEGLGHGVRLTVVDQGVRKD